jgi:dTDP-4-amino-4,6-dideoxygalactose transaminase
MDRIMSVAQKHNLFVVEDVAQAIGGMWKGKKLGSIGTIGAFSFFPSKNLGGFGDGGMVATNDERLAELVRMLLKHGGKDKYNVDHIGYNARLDTLQAAVLLEKLPHLDTMNHQRRTIADNYNKTLSDIKDLEIPVCPNPGTYHVYHQYTVCTHNGRRDSLQTHLKAKGISTMVYYPFPLHKMVVFQHGRSHLFGTLQNVENTVQGVLSLPVDPLQSQQDTHRVIQEIREFFGQ